MDQKEALEPIKKDALFILGLALQAQKKEPSEWNIALFKASFVRKVKKLTREQANEVMLYMATKGREAGLKTFPFAMKNELFESVDDFVKKEIDEMYMVTASLKPETIAKKSKPGKEQTKQVPPMKGLKSKIQLSDNDLLFLSGSYMAAHPERILGDEKIVKTKYNKDAKYYTGDPSYINKIQVESKSGDTAMPVLKTKKPNYYIGLGSVPNIDIVFQGSRSEIINELEKKHKLTYLPGNTIEDLIELQKKYISTYDIGGGNYIGGTILDSSLQPIAYMSYNGRIWNNESIEKELVLVDGKLIPKDQSPIVNSPIVNPEIVNPPIPQSSIDQSTIDPPPVNTTVPALTSANPTVTEIQTADPEGEDQLANMKRAIDNAKEELLRKDIGKTKSDVQYFEKPVPELFTFEENFKKLNAHLSNDEIESFVWWRSKSGKPLKGQWTKVLEKDNKKFVGIANYGKSYDVVMANGKQITLSVRSTSGGNFISFYIEFEGLERLIDTYNSYRYDTFKQQNQIWRDLKEMEISNMNDIEDEFGISYRAKLESDEFTNPNYAYEEDKVSNWVKNGNLYYFRGELLPAPIYLAEDIWGRKTALTNDEATIVEQYGREVYENQSKALSELFDKVYANRLTLDHPDISKRLVILPNSDFALNYKINSLADMVDDASETDTDPTDTNEEPQGFKVAKVTAQSKRDYGQVDWMKTMTGRDRDRNETVSLSLTEAFIYYLYKNSRRVQIKRDTDVSSIVNIYLHGASRPEEIDPTIWARKKASAKAEGDRLFSEFLATQITIKDRVAIETNWNSINNTYIRVNYNKIPVGFTTARMYRGEEVEIRGEKREAVAFLSIEGSGCLAYDVGFGKTWSAIFAISQAIDSEQCSRPAIIVPNQVYKQFILEIKGLLPHLQVVELYNLSKDYIDKIIDENGQFMMVPEKSITVLTYEGFMKFSFSEETIKNVTDELKDILYTNRLERSTDAAQEKSMQRFISSITSKVGQAQKGGTVPLDSLGIDFICWDEAHAMKRVFTDVPAEKNVRGKNTKQYTIAGSPSDTALKGFMVSQYILQKHGSKNILLLTATPFTNAPIEIYSMLSLIGFEKMARLGVKNIKAFFDTYIDVSDELVINAKLQPQRKQVVVGFNNLVGLQQLINRFINFKNADTVDADGNKVKIARPDKYVLPLNRVIENGDDLSPDILSASSIIQMSPEQELLIAQVKQYVESGNENFDLGLDVEVEEVADDEESQEKDMDEWYLDFDSMDQKEKAIVRILQGMSYLRNISLSPYLFKKSGLGRPKNEVDYIESSPKLMYVMKCIASVKAYHEEHNEPISGQVLYMERGNEYFGLIKKYLVNELGFKPHEVDIIESGMPASGPRSKEAIKNKFLGDQYDPATGITSPLPDEDRIKVLIGSATIKEGINLQKYASVLYNLTLDWNPTDIIQLEGRIWRQGNRYGAVRIVNPLLADSIDIFINQKLYEKTERINKIWSSNGATSVLKTEDFDPSELKYALINDPMVIAELEADERKANLNEEKAVLKQEKNYIDEITQKKAQLDSEYSRVYREAAEYRTVTEGESISSMLQKILNVVRTQYDQDELAKPIKERKKISEKSKYGYPYHKPWWLSEVQNLNRYISRTEANYLKPKQLTYDMLPARMAVIDQKIAEIDEKINQVESTDALKARAQEIILMREANKTEMASVDQRVEEFKSLNYLLSKLAKKPDVKPAMQCPPVDDKGLPRIDPEGLDYLDQCIAKLTPTKAMHIEDDGSYTASRQKLHQRIIKSMVDKAKCIKRTQPIAILTGGLPGSGKSTFIKKYAPWINSDNLLKIDADEIRAMLPEYRGWNSAQTHFETRDIVNQLLDNLGKPCEYDIVYDGTMNKADNYLPLIAKLREMGYKIFVIYINVDFNTSITRAMERYRRGGVNGRYVPRSVIAEAAERGTQAYDKIKQLADGWIQVDGITHEVQSTGGEAIPEERNYKFTNGKRTKEQVNTEVQQMSEAEEIQQAIDALTLLVDDANEDPEITDAIEALKLLL